LHPSSARGFFDLDRHTRPSSLAPQLPLPIPVPLAKGVAGEGYPFPWSVYRWLPGAHATVERIADVSEFASTLGGFLTALQRIDSSGGPPPGLHSAFRGGPLERRSVAGPVQALACAVPAGGVRLRYL